MLTQQRPGVLAAVLEPEDEPAFWCNLTVPPLERSRAAALDVLGGAYALPPEPQPGLYGGTLDIPPPPAAIGLHVGLDCLAAPFLGYSTDEFPPPPAAAGLAAGIDCTSAPFVAYATGDLYPAARNLAAGLDCLAAPFVAYAAGDLHPVARGLTAGTDILDSIYLLGA